MNCTTGASRGRSGSAIKDAESDNWKAVSLGSRSECCTTGWAPVACRSSCPPSSLKAQEWTNRYHFRGKVTAFHAPWQAVTLTTRPQKHLWTMQILLAKKGGRAQPLSAGHNWAGETFATDRHSQLNIHKDNSYFNLHFHVFRTSYCQFPSNS